MKLNPILKNESQQNRADKRNRNTVDLNNII